MSSPLRSSPAGPESARPESAREDLEQALARELGAVEDAGLWRELREIESAQDPIVRLGGR